MKDVPFHERHECPHSWKRGYDSKASARVQAARLTKNSGVALAMYRCRYCNRWHLTHKTEYVGSKRASSSGVEVE